MVLEYDLDLVAHVVFFQRGVRDPEAHWHDFDGYDAYLTVRVLHLVGVVKFGEKVHVWVEPNPNAVDEEDWKPRFGSVSTVPVAQCLGWRTIRAGDCEGPEGENGEEL